MPKTNNDRTPDIDDDAFDAERAKRTIARLRRENTDLKEDRDKYRDKASQAQQGDKTVEERIKALEQRADNANRQLWTERALRKYGNLENVADLLVGESEDVVMTLAERLSKLAGEKKDVEQRSDDDDAGDGNSDSGASGDADGDDSQDSNVDDGDENDAGGDTHGSGGNGEGHSSSRPVPSLTPGHKDTESIENAHSRILNNVLARRYRTR